MTNTNITIAADLFNFADTAGVPDDVASAVNKERRSGLDEALYDAVVAVVNAAPKAVTLAQVIFVLHKLVANGSLEKVPADNTVRSYLNRARENGDIGKPTRQSYWTADKDAGDAAEEGQEGEGPEGNPAAPEGTPTNAAAEDEAEDDLDADPLA